MLRTGCLPRADRLARRIHALVESQYAADLHLRAAGPRTDGGDCRRELRDRDGRRLPHVRHAAGASPSCLRAATHEQGQAFTLGRQRLEDAVLETVITTGEWLAPIRPEMSEKTDRFFQPCATRVEVRVHIDVLLSVGADAHAEDEASAAQHVER